MLKAIRNLDYTVLICQNIEPMKQFYRDVLEFPICRDFGTWIEFQIGAVLLTLRERGTGYEGVREHDGQSGSGAGCQLAFRVDPSVVDLCYRELISKEVEIIQAPVDHQSTNHRTLFFKDPEGNILEIYAEL